MFLNKIQLSNFKSFQKQEWNFTAHVNLIYGVNGIGKTNLLDAIYMLALSKSYFSASDKQLVRDGYDYFRLEGEFVSGQNVKNKIVCKYKLDGKKTIEINGKKSLSASELVGKIPVVFIAPDDIAIVKQGSLERRAFMDRILCQADSTYLNSLINYNRLLRKKDILLKSDKPADPIVVEAYNKKMAPLAKQIFEKRVEFVHAMNPLLKAHYQKISGGREDILLSYESQVAGVEDVFKAFQDFLRQEISYKRALFGIQKDDLDFQMDEKALKKYGSQGQIKSFLYSIRIAEYIYLKQALGSNPILIMDDFFEKLDQSRLVQLLQLISEESVDQVFLSDTERTRSQRIFDQHQIAFDAFEIV